MLDFLITQCMYLVKVLGCLPLANTQSALDLFIAYGNEL